MVNDRGVNTLHSRVKNRYSKAYSRPFTGTHIKAYIHCISVHLFLPFMSRGTLCRVSYKGPPPLSSLHVNALMKYKFPVWRCFRWNHFHSLVAGVVSLRRIFVDRFHILCLSSLDIFIWNYIFNLILYLIQTLLEYKVTNTSNGRIKTWI